MFSFVIYDRRRRLLFGARDRMGKKPLFYTATAFGRGEDRIAFAFASELKALRAHPSIAARLRLSDEGLISYLLNDYVVGEQRIYEDIRSLEAGAAFEYGLPGSDRPGFRCWKYWDIAFDRHVTVPARNTKALPAVGRRVLGLLADAVERRMVADVPVGALLSGGVDSSTTVALMREFKAADRIETFSIGFDDASFDESAYAQRVAHELGVKHFSRRFTSAEMPRRLTRAIEALDEPFADPSILPVSMLCEFARQRVTVALAGDGGDELFAGYDPFRAVRAAERYQRLVPPWLHRFLMLPLSCCLPATSRNMGLQFKLSRFLRGAREDACIRPAVWMGAFTLEQLYRLMPGLRFRLTSEDAYAPMIAAYDRLAEQNADALDQTLDFFQRFYLVDDILVKVDRASMMHSLEVRSPFLDTALVEYVNGLPNWFKLRGGVTKYILKHVLLNGEGRKLGVPREIVERKKKGFGIPVARWIRHELRDVFRDALIHEWPASLLPMFEPAAIAELYGAHVAGRQNNYKELWALFVLSLWAQRHVTREPTSRASHAAAVAVS
jgi:asparagine synthase (glutamine-hydrolysing)